MSDENLPKEALLLKCLNMTTSDNDNIALVSIRKCNDILAAAGWTWEKLLAGKIKVVENPFKNTPNPFADNNLDTGYRRTPTPPPNPATQAKPTYRTPPSPPPRAKQAPPSGWANQAPPPPPPQKAASTGIFTARAVNGSQFQISTRTNNYSNHCYMCGTHVNSGDGYIFIPQEINPRALHKWQTLCDPCNQKVDEWIAQSPAPKNFNAPPNAPKANLNSL